MDTTSAPPPAPDPRRLWTVDDVAAYLAVSRRTVQRLAGEPGWPPPVRLGGRTRRWRPDDIARWADTRVDQPAGAAAAGRRVDAWA